MGLIIATLIVLVVIASALAQDFSVFSWAYWQEGDTSTSRSEVVRNLGLLAAGIIGLGFGIWRAYTAYRQTQASQRQAEAANEQARIAQQGHITDRFSTAVEHLGSEELPVRLGGIYALWRLIEDSPGRDVTSVIDILCAFVRHPPHEPDHPPERGAGEDGQAAAEKAGATNKIRPDVQAVLNLIGNEKDDYRALLPDGYRLDFTGANLADARLMRANLTRVNLTDANLTGAILTGADLTDADLWAANLTSTDLAYANLTGARLTLADLTDARLWHANLTGVYLSDANLTDARLWGANLTGADLGDGNVTQEQLDSACISKGGKLPTLPEDLKPPQNECVP